MIQADVLLSPFDLKQLPSANPISSPELVAFLDILDNGDLLEVFKTVWQNLKKGFPASQRDNWTFKKNQFTLACFRVWPLAFVADIPWAVNDGEAAAKRFELIRKFILPENALVEFLNSKEHFFEPFSPEETIFDPAVGVALLAASPELPPLPSNSRPPTSFTVRPTTSASMF